MRIRISAALAFAAAACSSPLRAQTLPADRVGRLEERLDNMDKKYQAELKKRDDEIAELKKQQEKTWMEDARSARIKNVTDDIINNIKNQEENKPIVRMPANFNPDIAVIGDFVASAGNRHDTHAVNRADVREIELDIRAPVDPRADAVFVLPFARDSGESLFHDEVLQGPETSAEIEEAYLFFHDFGVPNLTAKVGRYHVRFGRQNILHAHDLPTTDAPFVNQAFLAPEALVDSGVEFSYVIPNPWNQYFEQIVEINSGEGGGSESPTLRGDASVSSPSIVSHTLWNTDLAKSFNLELGASYLYGHPDSDNSHSTHLFGADATLIHTDPTGGFFNQLFQAEAIVGRVDQDDGRSNTSWGAYLLAQQQINKDWFTGVRLDYTQDGNNSDRSLWGVSPYVSWYWSEFLRLRLDYEHRSGDVRDEDILFFQITFIIGAHPPHPYWAMR